MGRARIVTPCVVVAALAAASVVHAQADHLECFKVRDALGATKYTADLGGLAVDATCVVKTPAKLLCVPTTKTNVAPAPPGAPSGDDAGAVLCYKVKCPRSAVPSAAVVDQFGARDVQPKVVKLLCAPATVAGGATTTTLPSTFCCQGLGTICSDRPVETAAESCGGTIAAPGLVCDGATGFCADARTGVSLCCQLPGPACFEGPPATEPCLANGVLVPDAECSPSGTCVGP